MERIFNIDGVKLTVTLDGTKGVASMFVTEQNKCATVMGTERYKNVKSAVKYLLAEKSATSVKTACGVTVENGYKPKAP